MQGEVYSPTAGFDRATLSRCIDAFFCFVGTTTSFARAAAAASDLSHMASAATPLRSVSSRNLMPNRVPSDYSRCLSSPSSTGGRGTVARRLSEGCLGDVLSRRRGGIVVGGHIDAASVTYEMSARSWEDGPRRAEYKSANEV